MSALVLLSSVCVVPATFAQAPAPPFLAFVKQQAATMRAEDTLPKSPQEWSDQRRQLRDQLLTAWGGFPGQHAPLSPRRLGTLQRDGYRVEKIVFQTLPDVWMTANAYVPDGSGRRPAVLCVHGHWKGAKQDPHVQARCIGLAKLGFFVLAVDAFGAGERGIGKALGEYHGEMVSATLFPIGRPLSGLQVYENQRAVDYLLTRPEVDGDRIGITGASGGGNQSMYAGAFDERVKAVVPVCSVGNYQAYLGAACCMCEVVPSGLSFTEEWGVLGLTAPRALMVINATKDAPQFSVAEANKSLKRVQSVYGLFDLQRNLRHSIFESKHDYNQPMREAMYGWMTQHLKGEGDGSPIAEPEFNTAEPQTLRCYPGDSRPDDWLTIPQFAAREARQLLSKIKQPKSIEAWQRTSRAMKRRLEDDILGRTKPQDGQQRTASEDIFEFEPEPGIRLEATRRIGQDPNSIVLVVSTENQHDFVNPLHAAGHTVVAFNLRATGSHAYPRDKIGRAADHNTAEWSMWLGRPLLGQWVMDVRAALTAIGADGRKDVTLIGIGPAGVVAICAAALDARISRVVTVGTLGSYISDVPYENQRLGIMAPGILRDAGDIPQLAALVAPKRLLVAGSVNGAGGTLDETSLAKRFEFTQSIYALSSASQNFSWQTSTTVADIVKNLDSGSR